MPRPRLALAAVVLLVLVAAGAYVAYDQVLSGDSVAPLALPSATSDATASGEPSAVAASSAADGEVAGAWTVTTGSQAGYRVREQLASVPAGSDAVGRTSDVSGSITIESDGTTTTLTGGTLTVDTTTASDERMRDNRLRTEGLETDAFPTATFAITGPVEIPAAAVSGTATDLTLTGDLTLHGVTRAVTIPAQARLVDGNIQVAGSITFPLADFEIVAPNVGGFIISIADEGALEFQVNFTKG